MAALAEANYSAYMFWLDKKSWTVDQAALLLVGLDPESFYEWSEYPDYKERQQYQSYFSMHRLIRLAIRKKEIPSARSPRDWITWTREKKLRVSNPFIEAINTKWPKQPAAQEAKPAKSDSPLGTRERTTLLVILAALAKMANVDLTKPSKSAVQIESVTEQLGSRVPQRTIEEHIKRVVAAIASRAN